MTILIIREKETTTSDSVRTPYFLVEKDENLLLDRDGSREAFLNQARIDAGIPLTDYASRQLSNRAWRYEAIFSSSTPSKRKLEVIGDIEVGFRYQAESKVFKRSVSVEDDQGNFSSHFASGGVHQSSSPFDDLVAQDAPRVGNSIGLTGGDRLRHPGIQVTPRVTHWIRATVVNGTITEEYENAIGAIMGRTNKVTYRGKPPDTFRFVSCTSTIRKVDMQITFGFDFRPSVGVDTWRAIDNSGANVTMKVPGHPGHFELWTWDENFVDDSWYVGPVPTTARQEILMRQPIFWWISKVHRSANFTQVLGL